MEECGRERKHQSCPECGDRAGLPLAVGERVLLELAHGVAVGDGVDLGVRHTGVLERPSTGHVALFGEVEFVHEDRPFSLTTTVFRE